MIDRVAAVLSGFRFRFESEAELQAGIQIALSSAGINHCREVILTATDRIDFLVGDCGIEVKISGAAAVVLRQLHRYAQLPEVGSLLLITTRANHGMPAELNGKPVRVLNISEAAL
jgi:hypothetical protein